MEYTPSHPKSSYKSRKVPADWRSANITAIYKKGNKKEPKNYRPVSLTSVICKIMVSIVRDIIMDNFLSNDLLSTNQYGFIKGRSTVIQLLKIMDECRGVRKPNFGSVSVYKNPNRTEPKPKCQIRNFGFRGFFSKPNLFHTYSQYLSHSHEALTFFALRTLSDSKWS